MVDLEVERLCVGSLDYSDVAPGPLVCLGQRVGPPVGPINLSTIHGDGKGMRQVFVSPQNLNQPRAVILSGVNGIGPVSSTKYSLSSCGRS